MKTIKSIRKTKEVELGEIKRVDDKTANNMVGSMWQYISKSEWKQATRKPKSEENQVGTKSESNSDQVKKKKNEKNSKKN